MFRVAFFTILLSIVTILLGSGSAEAALQFDFKKTEDGIPYVFVSGEFDFSDDLTAFERLVRTNSATAVTFHSPGGNIPKALQLGRLIRSLNLITIQPRATECSSACSLAFLGGVLRYAEPGAIGVHKSSFSGDTNLSREDAVAGVQQVTAEIITYMIEMGVDPALLQLSLQYDSDDIRYLSKSEMAKYKVVNLGTDQASQPSAPTLPSPTPVAPQAQPPAPPVASAPIEPRPVEVAGRKRPISPIAGDTRAVGWVYINSCSWPNPGAEEIKARIDRHSFAAMRLVPAQTAYFDRNTTRECNAANSLKIYSGLAPAVRNYAYNTASDELIGILGDFGMSKEPSVITLQRDDDDDYRFDIWLTSAPPARDYATLAIPQARSGRIRRPQGKAPLMSLPDTKSKTLTNLPNGIAISILGNSGRWYRARGGGQVGYLHDTWVYIDQYDSGPFAERHIQVKSFDNYPETEAYVRSSVIPLSAFIATNGWFAITLRDTYPQDTAKSLVKVMKENGTLPDDSYVTYGNTYVRKVCCQ